MIDDTHERDFKQEEEYLQETIAFIDSEIVDTEARRPGQAAHQEAANAIQKNMDEYISRLKDAQPKPYFGRIDFRWDRYPNSKKPYYIGKHFIRGHVYSWEAPIAALYYNPMAGGYKVRDGYVKGRV
jgi:DNA helicase IV